MTDQPVPDSDSINNVRISRCLFYVSDITEKEYYVRGCTALLDAIGGAIHHIGNIHKYARPEDVPEHTLFVITTDGMETPVAATRLNG